MEYRTVGIRGENMLSELDVGDPQADIRKIFGIVRRRYPAALLGGAVGLALAIAFLLFAEPTYTSSIRILLDQDRSKLLTEISGEIAPSSADEYIATQLAVVGSDIVARRVINDLQLTYDPGLKRLRLSSEVPLETAALPRANAVSAEDLVKLNIDPKVVSAVQKSVKVYQVEKSFVLEIGASDPDPVVAQKIARAYGLAYLTDQLSARFEATRNAGSWLEGRIDTLRDQSLEANAAVEKFRKDNNLVSTDGRLVSDQQLSGLNVELGTARSNMTKAAARVSVFEDALDRGDAETILGIAASSADISETAPIKTLRSDYLQASERQREVTARWGAENEQAKALASEVARLSALVLEEARRILRGYRNDLQLATSEADSILNSVKSATAQSQVDNTLQVQLRGLEQRATSYTALYQDYLARYQEAVQQQTLSLTTGRLISQPDLPSTPIFPNKKIILALSLLLGIGVGGGIGVARELLDASFRSSSEVESAGFGFLGYVKGGGKSSWLRRRIWRRVTPTYAQDRFEPSLKAIRIAMDIRHRGRSRSLGFVSVQPSLERSQLALAYARREAAGGLRVLLVDGDTQDGGLTKTFSLEGAPSLQDVLAGSVAFERAVVKLEGGLAFLPIATGRGLSGVKQQAAGDRLPDWHNAFDLVVTDLSQASPISEARALAGWFDAFVCVVGWGSTPVSFLQKLSRSSAEINGKLLGVVLTNVPAAKVKLYDPLASQYLA